MTAAAWVGILMSQPDGLNGTARVLRLMLYYGWTDSAITSTTATVE